MKLKKLFKGISVTAIKGMKDIEITGISSHSKYVVPGNLFIVRKGSKFDGSNFIAEAMEGGAVALLTDMYNPFHKDIVQVIHPNPKAIEGIIASKFYKNPSQQLFMVGITGTNGKTTCAYLIQHMFNSLNFSCGLMGTIETVIGSHRKNSINTTSDVITNHKLLRDMIHHKCQASVMEVTSHGLDQGRVENIEFDVAVFTNLTPDHLDYHESIDSYFEAKSKLFSALKMKKSPKTAVINADSSWGQKIKLRKGVKVLTYGLSETADVQAKDICLEESGIQFTIYYKGESASVNSRLIGRFNVSNLLAAASVGIIRGYPLKLIASVLSLFTAVPGRLERVENSKGYSIFVDYAHTEDALKNVLAFLQEFKKGRLVTVFGCGGDRDQSKRPKMGQAVQQLSDIAIVTSDNPRTENPQAIIQDILNGMQLNESVIVELDRKKAIEKAVSLMERDDLLLIAGKGHEKLQIFAHQTIPFDDVTVAQEAVANLQQEVSV